MTFTEDSRSDIDVSLCAEDAAATEAEMSPEQAAALEAELAQGPAVDAELLAGVTLAIHKLPKRHRRIEARITLPYACEQVWQVLTDYEGLADFIPNLAVSQRLEHPKGGIRLEQVGVQSALFLKFSARVVLDMVETFPHTIAFTMVEGDFNHFAGVWQLTPIDPEATTELAYTLEIGAKRLTPVFAIEKRLCYDLPRNLVAIRQHLDAVSG